VRWRFFGIGIRRSEIAEYRLAMQKLYAAALQVVQDRRCDPGAVWRAFRASVEAEDLRAGRATD
jgi:hypothetical protein